VECLDCIKLSGGDGTLYIPATQAMLLILTRPSNSADLAAMQVDNWRFSPEGAVFLPAALAKQSRQGTPLKFPILFRALFGRDSQTVPFHLGHMILPSCLSLGQTPQACGISNFSLLAA